MLGERWARHPQREAVLRAGVGCHLVFELETGGVGGAEGALQC